MLQGEGIASDDQILQSWELGHWVEELLFMWYFIEGEIELFQMREDLVWDRDVARWEVTAMELNKLVPG